MATTARRSNRYPTLANAANVPLDVGNLAQDLDDAPRYDRGTLAARPAFGANAGIGGRFYWATDTLLMYFDTGIAWVSIGPSGGIGPDSITAIEIAPDAVTAVELKDSAATDADRAVTSDHIRNSAVINRTLGAGAVDGPKINDSLKPSAGAAGATESLRALGTAAGTAAAGAHKGQHAPGGADAIDYTLVNLSGTLGARPAPAATNAGLYYLATDANGGTIYRSTGGGGSWVQAAAAVSGTTTPGPHQASHLPGGSDSLDWTGTINRRGTLASRPAAGSGNGGTLYFATDVLGGTWYRSSGSAWEKQALGLEEGVFVGQLAISTVLATPAGWLLADGTPKSRTTYSALNSLYAAEGYKYGAGDGVNTFNVPAMKGRIPIGVDSAVPQFNVLGEVGGTITHVLSINEMPNHDHGGGNHVHTTGVPFMTPFVADTGMDFTAGGVGYRSDDVNPSGAILAAQGGGIAHENMPPYITVYFFVKY